MSAAPPRTGLVPTIRSLGELTRDEPNGQRVTVRCLHQGTVTDDQADGRAELHRYGTRVMEGATGGQHHFHTAGHRGVDRPAVGVGQTPAAIEQRAVDVDRDETDRAGRAS